jgi:putative phosphoribosyl transferase
VSLRRYLDRASAGRVLAEALPSDLGADVLVIGLARGGVETAAAVARALGAPLDALAVRKVGHPLQPEYGIGAVAPGGDGVYVRSTDGLRPDELAAAVARATQAARELDARLHAAHPALDPVGRTVVLVDDGLATGSTMTAAVRWARGRGAARVLVAVPVAASQSAERLRAEADVVCPLETDDLGAVGLWYEHFGQVREDAVLDLLDELRSSA